MNRLSLRTSVAAVVTTLTISGVIACNREGVSVSRTGGPLDVVIDTTDGIHAAKLLVHGLSDTELASLRSPRHDSALTHFMRVSVQGHEDVAIAGTLFVSDSAVGFRPQFPLDAGMNYSAIINADALHSARSDSTHTFVISLPADTRVSETTVSRVLPGSDTLPENLLRFYIEFARPMSRTSGLDHIKLLDENGHEVLHAFLPLDADFWNEDRTRYTAFLDPGRVKRGILPNEQMGRAIRQGHRYTIVIDSAWQDAHGLPLTSPFRHTFTVGAPAESRIDLKSWSVSSPTAGTRDALVVTFSRALDYGLLKRAVGVERVNGEAITGSVLIENVEKEWRFTPIEPWKSSDYRLVVFSSLEDAAGNRIDRPFEVDMFERVDSVASPERYFVPFSLRKR